jgi:hypothetical protein
MWLGVTQDSSDSSLDESLSREDEKLMNPKAI